MRALISVAIATAYVYSGAVVFGLVGKRLFCERATLVDSMLLGHWIELKSVMGASRSLEALAKLMPSDAHKLMPDGTVKDVPLGELAVNDRVLIKPGEKIAADGLIVDGESSGDEAMLTGESTPVSKKKGGKVIGGAINGEGSLTIEVKGGHRRQRLRAPAGGRSALRLGRAADACPGRGVGGEHRHRRDQRPPAEAQDLTGRGSGATRFVARAARNPTSEASNYSGLT